MAGGQSGEQGADGVEDGVERGHDPAEGERPLEELDGRAGRRARAPRGGPARPSAGQRSTTSAAGTTSRLRFPTSWISVASEPRPVTYQRSSTSRRAPGPAGAGRDQRQRRHSRERRHQQSDERRPIRAPASADRGGGGGEGPCPDGACGDLPRSWPAPARRLRRGVGGAPAPTADVQASPWPRPQPGRSRWCSTREKEHRERQRHPDQRFPVGAGRRRRRPHPDAARGNSGSAGRATTPAPPRTRPPRGMSPAEAAQPPPPAEPGRATGAAAAASRWPRSVRAWSWPAGSAASRSGTRIAGDGTEVSDSRCPSTRTGSPTVRGTADAAHGPATSTATVRAQPPGRDPARIDSATAAEPDDDADHRVSVMTAPHRAAGPAPAGPPVHRHRADAAVRLGRRARCCGRRCCWSHTGGRPAAASATSRGWDDRPRLARPADRTARLGPAAGPGAADGAAAGRSSGAFGQDRLARQHRVVGFTSFNLMLAHIVLITWGYAAGELTATPATLWNLTVDYPGMLLAVAGTVCLVMVVVTSIRAARRRLRYESWHLLHLYAYLGVGPRPAAPAVDRPGVPRLDRPPRSTGGRCGRRRRRGARLAGRLCRCGAAPGTGCGSPRSSARAPGSSSVYMTGRRPGPAAGARPGSSSPGGSSTGPGWTRAHPYSLSAAPDGRSLRITVKDARRRQRARCGTCAGHAGAGRGAVRAAEPRGPVPGARSR